MSSTVRDVREKEHQLTHSSSTRRQVVRTIESLVAAVEGAELSPFLGSSEGLSKHAPRASGVGVSAEHPTNEPLPRGIVNIYS